MIVNENLSTKDKIILTAKDISARFESVIIDNLGLVDGETYTFSADLSLSEGEEATIIIFNSDYTINHRSTKLSTKKRSSLTFVYNNESTSRIACYAGIHGSTNGISAEYTKIKIEKGDQMTPYLPHKSNVSAVDQAIFPIGGGVSRSLPYIEDIRGLIYVN